MNLPARLATALALLLAPACASGRDAVLVGSPQDLPAYEALEADEAALEKAVEAAALTPDPADDVAAQDALDQVELALAELEEKGIRGQGAPFKDALPYGLGVLALEASVAIFSKRKRKLYVSAAKALGKGQVATMVGDVLKAYGAQHSTPPPTQTEFTFPSPVTLYVSGVPKTDPFDNGPNTVSSS